MSARAKGFAVVPGQRLDLAEAGLSESDIKTAAWWVDGVKRESGHKAIALALQAMGGIWAPLGKVVRAGGPVSALAYRLIARYRHRLPGGSPACRLN